MQGEWQRRIKAIDDEITLENRTIQWNGEKKSLAE